MINELIIALATVYLTLAWLYQKPLFNWAGTLKSDWLAITIINVWAGITCTVVLYSAETFIKMI